MRTIIEKLVIVYKKCIFSALFVLYIQDLVHGQQSKESDFCATELKPGIDASWVDNRFASLVNKKANAHDSFVIYEIVLDFEFQLEKMAVLLEYRIQGNSCRYTVYEDDGSVMKNQSRHKRYNPTEIGNALRHVVSLGEMTILKQCTLLPRDFGDTRTLLFINDGTPVLLIHLVGGHDLYTNLEGQEQVTELLRSYLRLKSKME